MGNILEASQIDTYIEELENCYEDARRDYEQKDAQVKAIEKDYARKDSKFQKVKSYWEKIQYTNELGGKVNATLANLEKIIDQEINFYADLDAKAIKVLLYELRELAEMIEHQYNCCLGDLNKRIDQITDANFNKESGIVSALKVLSDAYLAALEQATVALEQVLSLTHHAYHLRYSVNSEELEDTCLCCEERQKQEAKTKNIDPNSPCSKINIAKDTACEREHQESLKESVELMITSFADEFPMMVLNEDGAIIKEDKYHRAVRTQYDSTEEERKVYFDNLSYAKQCRDLAKSKMDAMKSSLEAAKAAKAC
ncbi:MAG: hypothetical protein AAF806_10165 [Bacteroidota bacterium]